MTAKPNTASKKSRGRGSQPGKKPVTIELEAEKIVTAEHKASAKTESKASATSKSRESAKPTQKQSVPKTGATSSVGRDATKGSAGAGKGEGGGFLGKIAAGIIGGLIVLGGGYGLQYAGILPSPSNQTAGMVTSETLSSSTADLNSKIAALEKKLAESSSTESVDQAAVEAAIDARLAALPKTEPDAALREQLDSSLADSSAKIVELQTRLDKTVGALDSLQSSLSSGESGDAAALSTLNTRMESLSGELTALRNDVSNLSGGATTAEISAMGTSLTAVLGKVGTLESGLAEMRTKTDALPSEIPSASAVASLSGELAGVKSGMDAVQQKLGGQQEKLAAVQNQLENGADKKAARALAAAALKSDIDRGLPFSESLSVLKSVATKDVDLSALESHADKGIPSATALADRFDSVRDAVIAATTEVQKEGSLSRLTAGLKSFVKVKSRGPIDGDTPLAILSRIGAAVTSGDLQNAATEWAALPPAGQAASGDWHDDLQARLAANSVVANTVQNFMSTSSKPSGTGN